MRRFISIVFITTALVGFGEPKEPILTITDVKTGEVGSPVYETTDGIDSVLVDGLPLRQTSYKKWFRISAHYETRPEWIDRLSLEFYVLLKDERGEGTLFKGVADYVNIPAGQDHLADMYMHFNSYRRYNHGDIKVVVIAKVDGEIIAIDRQTTSMMAKDQNNMVKWWEQYPINCCQLLNRLDTPFRVIDGGQYQAPDFSTRR